MALCVGPDLEYVEVKVQDAVYILAAERVAAVFGGPKAAVQPEIIKTYQGSDLVGQRYEPLFPFFSSLGSEGGAFRVVSDAYVSTGDGTGIVHQSPAHGEDDYRVCKANQIPFVDPVDYGGNFDGQVGDLAGLNVKEADKVIIKKLRELGRLVKHETIEHNYPYCQRSGTPLIYKAISAWYVRVEDLREEMAALNSTIRWVPESIGTGRFGNWLKEARDWNISRNRFWGAPIPVWRCDVCNATSCISSVAELQERSGAVVTDLHKHLVDELTWGCESCGAEHPGTMRRVPEVLDCWFESGSMPYAQLHYPFENKDKFEQVFPADFIAEALDQTRGWFYTLLVLSTALFKRAPFKNCVVTGLILAEDGRKMSKSLKNYPDPARIMEEYGADALRLYMVNSPVLRGEPFRFAEAGVKDIVRSVLLPYWNVYSFFTTYAEVDHYKPSVTLTGSQNILDRWILSRFASLVSAIHKEMALYRIFAVVPLLLGFLEELSNWYLRRSRRRFWENDQTDKQHAYDTLYVVLLEFSKALAPFAPFVTEAIYRNLATLFPGMPESVHLCDFPQESLGGIVIDKDLESGMALIVQAVELGRSLRARLNVRVRQPLQSITVVTRDVRAAQWLQSYGEHLKEELNVKEVLFSTDEAAVVSIAVKPNFPVLGPRFGARMKEAASLLSKLAPGELQQLEQTGEILVLGQTVLASELTITRSKKGTVEIETGAGITVFYDTIITPQLLDEGRARECINRLQKARKDANLRVSDRIQVTLTCSEELAKSLQGQLGFIADEVLAREISFDAVNAAHAQNFTESTEIEGMPLTLGISVV
jgi:isoleucyl-tRNA synthetase